MSPQLLNAALAAAGLVGSYERRRVDAPAMAEVITAIRDRDLDGANVTMPHKQLAADLCDRTAATAVRAGAVNTLLRVADTVVGHNTDIAGIRSAWSEAGLLERGPVLVLGTGGAAAAALLALEDRPIHITGRRAAAAAALLVRVGVSAAVVPWGEPVPGAVVVNATPLGMQGEELDADVLAAATGLFDMVYGVAATPAARHMWTRGLPVVDGRAMLLHQAAMAFELWTGRPAPLDAMREALTAR